jgi:hypothetical protein
MGSIMVMGISLMLYILFGRIVPWAMGVTIALLLGRQKVAWKPLLLVVFIGLIHDIAYFKPLGVSSAILIVMMFATWLLSQMYRSKLLWWWYILGGVGQICFDVITQGTFSFAHLFIQLLVLLIVRLLWIRFIQPTEGIYVGT